MAVWYLMRHLDSVGSGRVLEGNLKALVKHEHLMSQEMLRQRLLEGEGQFWNTKTVGEKQLITYRSLERVSAILGVMPSKAVMIPLEAFSQVAKIRAYFYASLFAGKTNPISRETIAKTWGIPESTQRRYEQLAGITVDRNIARREIDPWDGWQVGEGAFVYHHKGKWYLCRDLPNSYRTDLVVERPGMIRRVSKKLRALQEGRATVNRVFFATPEQALRSKNRAREVYWRDGRFGRQGRFHGALLWSPLCQCLETGTHTPEEDCGQDRGWNKPMKIPSSLKAESKYALIRIIRAMQSAIKEECFECVGAASVRRVKNCPGNRLSNGRSCPLYGFRPGADS